MAGRQIRRGTNAERVALGGLSAGEFGFETDTEDLYIGAAGGDQLVSDASAWAHLTGQDQAVKTTSSPAFAATTLTTGRILIPGALYTFRAGYQAGNLLTTGTGVLIGHQAGLSWATGLIIAIGNYAGAFGNAGTLLAIGSEAALATGTGNVTAVGHGAARVSTLVATCFGYNAGRVNTTGNIVAIGKEAGLANLTGGLVAVGNGAASKCTSGMVVAVGNTAASDVTAGFGTLVGHWAGASLTTGTLTALGQEAGYHCTTGLGSVCISMDAGYENTDGVITALGFGAGYHNDAHSLYGGLFLGHHAGFYETGADKLFIDYRRRGSEANDDQGTDEATARVTALIYGQFAAATADQYLWINGRFGVLLSEVVAAANNAAAQAAGVLVGQFYRTNADPSVLCIRTA